MELVNVSELKQHTQNEYFFDNIKDENWEQFLESVKENGIIQPIVIAKDKTIISGHQRVRACKELGIKQIHAKTKDYKDLGNLTLKDAILEDLLLTNLRQRGIGNSNPVKMGRCIEELKRIKGIKHGNYTKKELSNELSISTLTMEKYSKLTKVVPEIQNMIMDGKITAEIGQVIFSKLDDVEQRKMLNLIGIENISNAKTKDIENKINIIKDNSKENIETIKEIIKIIPPDDYEEIKQYVDLYKKEIEDKKIELKKANSLIQSMKASDEGLAQIESKRKRISEEVKKAEIELHNINKLYGDATDTLKKQTAINQLLDEMKDKVKLLESKIVGFKPHRMGEENFKISINSFKEIIVKSLDLINKINLEEEGELINDRN